MGVAAWRVEEAAMEEMDASAAVENARGGGGGRAGVRNSPPPPVSLFVSPSPSLFPFLSSARPGAADKEEGGEEEEGGGGGGEDTSGKQGIRRMDGKGEEGHGGGGGDGRRVVVGSDGEEDPSEGTEGSVPVPVPVPTTAAAAAGNACEGREGSRGSEEGEGGWAVWPRMPTAGGEGDCRAVGLSRRGAVLEGKNGSERGGTRTAVGDVLSPPPSWSSPSLVSLFISTSTCREGEEEEDGVVGRGLHRVTGRPSFTTTPPPPLTNTCDEVEQVEEEDPSTEVAHEEEGDESGRGGGGDGKRAVSLPSCRLLRSEPSLGSPSGVVVAGGGGAEVGIPVAMLVEPIVVVGVVEMGRPFGSRTSGNLIVIKNASCAVRIPKANK